MTAHEASPTARPHGRLIVLNGTSSAGKTTLSEALQGLLDEPYLLMGYNRTWAVMTPRYLPFQPQDREGIWYNLHPDDSSVATGIGIGPVGHQAVTGVHHMVAALLAQGLNVIVDVLLMERVWFDEARCLWQPFDPLWVALKPPLEVSERWEAEGEMTRIGRPTGLARWAYDAVHAHGSFDLEIDTSLGTPEAAARIVIARLHAQQAPA